MAWGRSAVAILLLAAVAACGDDDAASVTDSTVATTSAPASSTVPPATVAATVPPTSATASVTTAECGGIPAFDLEAELRPQFVDYLMSCGFTEAEATCLFDGLDYTDRDVAAGRPEAIEAAFEACGIAPERMAEIGGA